MSDVSNLIFFLFPINYAETYNLCTRVKNSIINKAIDPKMSDGL